LERREKGLYREMFTTRTLGRWCSSSARQQLLDVGGNTTMMTSTTMTMRSTMIAGIMARSISSDFAEQMKSYETKVFLPNSSPIVVRLDGSSFRFESISLSPSRSTRARVALWSSLTHEQQHKTSCSSLTKNFNKPWDSRSMLLMFVGSCPSQLD